MKVTIQTTVDPRTAETIWRGMHKALRVFISKRISDAADVEDVLQEVFLRVHRRVESVRDRRRLTGWIYQIVRNTIVDYYRMRSTRRDEPVGLGEDLDAIRRGTPRSMGGRSSVEGDARQELSACIRPMIAQLSQEYRAALTMVELEGYTQRVAAQKMGISVSGMKSRVQRGRGQLKQMLHRCCLIQLDRRKNICRVF